MRALIALALFLIAPGSHAQGYRNAFLKAEPLSLSVGQTINVSVAVENVSKNGYPLILVSATLMDPKGDALELANTSGIKPGKDRHQCQGGANLMPEARQVMVFRFKGSPNAPKGDYALLLDLAANPDNRGCQLFSVSLDRLKAKD